MQQLATFYFSLHIARGTHNSLSPNPTDNDTLYKEKNQFSSTTVDGNTYVALPIGNVGGGAAKEKEGKTQLHMWYSNICYLWLYSHHSTLALFPAPATSLSLCIALKVHYMHGIYTVK